MKSQTQLFDSHAHLYDLKFNTDRDALVNLFDQNAISHVMVPAENLETSKTAINIASSYDKLFCAVGQHPHNAELFEDRMLEDFYVLLNNKKVLAVGEIGLDYHYDFSPREKQKTVFETFLNFALSNDKPVIIHNRKSESDLISILKNTGKFSLKGVIHCFDSTLDYAKQYLDMGLMISFSGLITFGKNEALKEALKYVPLERLMIETDSPYLAPHPFRGKRNEPAYVRYVAEKIADLKKLSFDEIAEITAKNACRLFGIS